MAFSSSRTFRVSPDYIPVVATDLCESLRKDGYEVAYERLMGDNVEVSISKGGFFRSVSGMKTALKITFTGMGDRFRVDCKVGIFGQQVVPTAISMLLFWPVMITQIWGLIRQSKLDDHVLELVDGAIDCHAGKTVQVEQAGEKSVFCSACGARVKGVFCSACGAKL